MKRHQDPTGADNAKRRNVELWTYEDILSDTCQLEYSKCRKICELLEEGCSIPFIARYRREVTGNLGPDQLRHFQDQYEALKEVKEKAEKLIKKVSEQGLLTSSLEHAIKNSISIEEIELLAAPFKSSSATQTLAARAKHAGLEPVAQNILKGHGFMDINSQLRSFVDPKVDNLSNFDKVSEGVCHLLADEIVHCKEAVNLIGEMVNNGYIILESKEKKSKTAKTTKTTKAKDKKGSTPKKSLNQENKRESVFKNYHDFSMPIRNIKPHQVLAINRGEKLKELTVRLVLPEMFASKFENFFVRFYNLDRCDPARANLVRKSIQDGFKRLVGPLVIRRVRANLNRNAEKAALDVFAENLRNLLLIPPCKGNTILGIDPGYKNGCKMAVISPTGDVLDTGVIFPTFQSNKNTSAKDKSTIKSLISNHGVDLISIGNGNGCRDVEKWVTSIFNELPEFVKYTIVTEDGASIYSCSPEGLKENPGLEPTSIGAVSIARRLQDPLSEFVKIGPKHIGVGMYQHDLSEQKLKKSLKEVLLECVSFVGLDLNTAPIHLLRHVSGITEAVAKNIIEFRTKNGPFNSRLQLRKVKGIGEKVFEQCAGFVRIDKDCSKNASSSKKSSKDGVYNPLDSTLVHPESYELAQKIIEIESFKLDDIGSQKLIDHFNGTDPKKFEKKIDDSKMFERVPQIVEALRLNLNADIRDEKSRPVFRRDVLSIENLHVGIVVTGVVRNVTHFGAFVDIGVGTDGLVHVSKMRGSSLLLGQKVEVKVLEVDRSRERIGLGLEKVI